MSSIRCRIAILPALLLLTALLAGCATTVRRHPDFEARRKEIASVSVMPPQVEFVRIVFKGDDEPLREESSAVARRLPGLVAAELRSHGFDVKEAGLYADDSEDLSEMRFETTQISRAFAEASGEMYQQPLMIESDAMKYERSLGADVNLFADRAEVDALVFAKMWGFKKSSGEIAKDAAMTVLIAAATLGSVVSVQPTAGATIRIALVDGTTGDVLWANTAGTNGDFEGRGLNTLIAGLFKQFPE